VFSFHDDDEIGPRMLARIAKRTGLRGAVPSSPPLQPEVAADVLLLRKMY
jgi:hypothetical protein